MTVAARVTIVGGVWTLLHLYVGSHLIGGGGAAASPELRLLGWAGVLLLAWLPLASLITARRGTGAVGGGPLRGTLDWVGFTALGLSSLLIVFFGVADVLRLPVSGVTVLACAALVTAGGAVQAGRPRVVRVSVPIVDLPRDLEGFRIVQLSDLHVGPTLKRGFVERVVATANALDPDVVALTGDSADSPPR